MDNYIFRTALNGFNRQDVIAYIEKAQKEAAERAAQLEQEIEELRREKMDLLNTLESCEQERDVLNKQLAEQKKSLDETQTTCKAVFDEKEALVCRLSECEEELEAVKADRNAVTERVKRMEDQIEIARYEKESVTQLELEARKRAEIIVNDANHQAEELLAQARSKAQALITSANEQAQNTLDEACGCAEEVYAEVEERVQSTAKKYTDLFASFETVTTHVSNELRKMDVALAQLPINFNHLKDGLENILEQTRERSGGEK